MKNLKSGEIMRKIFWNNSHEIMTKSQISLMWFAILMGFGIGVMVGYLIARSGL